MTLETRPTLTALWAYHPVSLPSPARRPDDGLRKAPNLHIQMASFHNPAQLSIFHDSEAQTLRERAAAILWVKSQMARHGITAEDLLSAGCFGECSVEPNGKARAQYKDATGHSWDGEGTLPEWLQRAVNAGQSVEHFKVA